MKKLRSILAALILMLAALAMSGCKAGSSIDTILSVEEDMSGSRVMKIAIDDSVFQQYFTGTIEDLQELVKTTCPSDLSWTYADSEGVKAFTFVLNFTDVDDYRTKISNILGGEKEIVMEAPDSIWASGVNIREDFTSQDLMEWLKNAVVEGGFVSSDNASQIFSIGGTEVVYKGESRISGNHVDVNTISYLRLNNVKLFVEALDLSSYHVSVRFEVPEGSMSAKGEEIRAYIQSVAPADSEQKEETLSDGGTAFSIGKQFIDRAGLESFCQSVFGAENASVSDAGEALEDNPFEFVQCSNLKVCLANYVSHEGYGTDFYLLVKVPSGYFVADGYVYDETNYPGFMLLERYGTYGDEKTHEIRIRKTFAVNQLDVETTEKMGDKWKRVTTFTLTETPKEEELSEMVRRFEKRVGIEEKAEESTEQPETAESTEVTEVSTEADQSEEKKPEYKVEVEKKDGNVIIITQTGKDYELNETGALLYGGNWNMTSAEENGFAKVKKSKAIVDQVDYSRLVTSLPENFVMNYRLKLAGLNSFEYTNVGEELLKEEPGNRLEATFKNTSAKVEWVGTSTDLLAVLFWVLIVAGCVMMLIGVLKSGLFVLAKAAPTAELTPVPEGAMTQTETGAIESSASSVETIATTAESEKTEEANPESEKTEETKPVETEAVEKDLPETKPVFCEKCGALLPAEGKFCEKCGAVIQR